MRSLGAAPRGRARITRDGLLSVVGLVALGGTRVVYGSLISRSTDHATYGTVGVLLGAATIGAYILPAGIAAASSRYIAFTRGSGDVELARGYYQYLHRASVWAGGGLAVIVAALASAFLVPTESMAFQVGLLAFAYSMYTCDKALLYGLGLVKHYLALELAGAGITLLSTVIVVSSSTDLYLAPLILGYGSFSIGARGLLAHAASGAASRPDHRALREVIGYIGLAALGTTASAGFLQGTQLLSLQYGGPSDVAFFAAAVTLIAPLALLPRAIGLAIFPSMSEAHGASDGGTIIRQVDIGTRLLLGVLAPVFAVAELLSSEILEAFGGPDYVAGAPVLRIMLVASFVAIVQVVAVNSLSSSSWRGLRIPVTAAVAGTSIGLLVVAGLGGTFGALGVAVGYLAGSAVTATGPIVAVARVHRLPWAGPFLRALVVVALAYLVGTWEAEPSNEMGIAKGLIAVLTVIGAFLVLRNDLRFVLTSVGAGQPIVGLRFRPPWRP